LTAENRLVKYHPSDPCLVLFRFITNRDAPPPLPPCSWEPVVSLLDDVQQSKLHPPSAAAAAAALAKLSTAFEANFRLQSQPSVDGDVSQRAVFPPKAHRATRPLACPTKDRVYPPIPRARHCLETQTDHGEMAMALLLLSIVQSVAVRRVCRFRQGA
jgi:hypothetical protein